MSKDPASAPPARKSSEKSGQKSAIVSIEGLGASRDAGPVDDTGAIAALRARAATSLERGLGFVADYGDELALLRELPSLSDATQPIPA